MYKSGYGSGWINSGRLPVVAAALGLLACAPSLADESPRLFSWEDGLTVQAGGMTLNAGVQLDYDRINISNFPGRDGSQSLLRRARPTIELDLGEKFRLRADYEFGQVSRGIKNAWLQWRALRSLTVRVGSQTAPFGLDAQQSSQDLPFVERPAASSLGPSLLVGAQVIWSRSHASLAAGYFGNSVTDDDRRQLLGRSMVVRATGNPLRSEHGFWHLGISAELRRADANATYRLDPRPESYAKLPRLVDTGTLAGVDQLFNLGFETAVQRGSAIVQGEYIHSAVGSDAGQFDSVELDGWYGSLAWLVTGERRAYSRGTAGFGGVTPRHRWGALEIAARTGEVSLSDAVVAGGTMHTTTLGLNWYLRPRARLMFSYARARSTSGAPVVAEPKLMSVRAQLSF